MVDLHGRMFLQQSGPLWRALADHNILGLLGGIGMY